MISPDHLLAIAESWLGVPYLHQGRSKDGVDCLGFVYCVGIEAGLLNEALALPNNYTRRILEPVLFEGLMKNCIKSPVSERGGLIVFKWANDPHPSHMAFYTGESMIHSYQRARRVVKHGYRRPWTGWTHSFWRIPGVAYE